MRETSAVFNLNASGEKIIYSGNGFGIIEAKPNQKSGDGAIDLSAMKMNLEPRTEWKQIFDEAWRIERDFYYDPNLRGVDWAAIKNATNRFCRLWRTARI